MPKSTVSETVSVVTEDASDENDGWLSDEVDDRVDTSLTETVDPEAVV